LPSKAHMYRSTLRTSFSSAAFNGEPYICLALGRFVSFRCRRYWSQALSPLRFNVLTDTVSRIAHAGSYD
jgi:hypothetical protein